MVVDLAVSVPPAYSDVLFAGRRYLVPLAGHLFVLAVQDADRYDFSFGRFSQSGSPEFRPHVRHFQPEYVQPVGIVFRSQRDRRRRSARNDRDRFQRSAFRDDGDFVALFRPDRPGFRRRR